MADPSNKVPKIVGILLDSDGIATSQVIAVNRSTGDRQIGSTDSAKRVVFDASNFNNGYSDGDVIEFENSGGSVGIATITLTSTGEFQSVTLDADAAPTVAISM